MSDFSELIVNQRFKLVHDTLERAGLIKSKSDLASKLGTYNHIIHNILNGKRSITVEQLNKLCEVFEVDANYMFGLNENMFGDGETQKNLKAHQFSDSSNHSRQNIILVPYKAQAGYALSPGSSEFLTGMQKFSLPGMDGSLIAFEVKGDSMMPSIAHGDLVVCESLENDEPIRENNMYVVVTDTVVVKRIQLVKEGRKTKAFRLVSDNEIAYKPYLVDTSEIRQVLRVKCRITRYAIG